MDGTDIARAITLFEFSRTAAAGGRAAATLAFLKSLYGRAEIGFVDLGRATLHGTWRAGRQSADLRVNPHYIEGLPQQARLGALSLLLVHEGTHAAVTMPKLTSELAARVLPIHYFRELSGPGVFDEGSDRTVHVDPDRLPEFRRQSAALARDQLIDHILAIETYTAPRYIDPQWIVDHLGLWGGLENRRPETKGLYVRILAASDDRHFVARIVPIMESVGSRDEWDAMMEEAGPRRRLQVSLDELSMDRVAGPRIAALARRWHVTLTDEPPRGR